MVSTQRNLGLNLSVNVGHNLTGAAICEVEIVMVILANS